MKDFIERYEQLVISNATLRAEKAKFIEHLKKYNAIAINAQGQYELIEPKNEKKK